MYHVQLMPQKEVMDFCDEADLFEGSLEEHKSLDGGQVRIHLQVFLNLPGFTWGSRRGLFREEDFVAPDSQGWV